MTVKVGSYRVRMQGKRGYSITLPNEWMHRYNVKPGDMVTIRRDRRGRLIIDRPRSAPAGDAVGGTGRAGADTTNKAGR